MVQNTLSTLEDYNYFGQENIAVYSELIDKHVHVFSLGAEIKSQKVTYIK